MLPVGQGLKGIGPQEPVPLGVGILGGEGLECAVGIGDAA